MAVNKLSKQFNGFMAIDRVSLEARAGEIFGLLGPNGAGKTTTIRVIATMLQPDSGTALVAGYDIRENPEAVRKNIGVLTTDIGVYERLSGRENLAYYGRLYGLPEDLLKKRINELVDLLDMSDFIDRRAGKYSTGMKQKLAIARSVVHDPKVIIFDEPTAGLDVLASQTVMRFMQKEKSAGKLVILSTHEMNDAEKLCNRVAIIHKGTILTVDTVELIKEKTQANDLEEAFVKLLKDDRNERSQSAVIKPPRKMNKKKLDIMIRIGAIVFIVLGFLSSFLAFSQTLFYVFVGLGVFLSIFRRYVLRLTKPGE